MMRFRDQRDVLLTGIDQRDHSNVATPRWISPYFSGRIAAALAEKSSFVPVPKPRKLNWRRRLRGVAIPPDQQLWKVAK